MAAKRRKRRVKPQDALTRTISFRVTQATYDRLKGISARTKTRSSVFMRKFTSAMVQADKTRKKR